MAQLVAHHTGSVGVRGSNPLSSTRKPQVRGTKLARPALIDQHYRPGVSALTRISYGGQGGVGEVVGCGLDVGDDEVKGQRGSAHPVQMIVDCSGFVGAESRGDDVGFIRSRDVRVSQSIKEANHVIDGGNGAAAGGLSGVVRSLHAVAGAATTVRDAASSIAAATAFMLTR
jgi:hypothetical protein